VSSRRQAVGEFTLAGLMLLGLVAFVADHVHSSPTRATPQVALPLVPAPTVVAPPANVIVIRWQAHDLAPAASAGRICVTGSRHGRICSSYVVGERPADTLTREIERRGLHVRSSG
jgi:hypothetical protein